MAFGYEWFSHFYDASLENLYRSSREAVVEHLDVQPDSRVLVVACGTGQDFPPLLERLGPEGRIIGLDRSPGMLKRAATREDPRITLFEGDAASIDPSQTGPVDRVLIALGLTVIPEWEETLRRCFELLEPGGKLAVFDVHAEHWVPQKTMVEWMAGADVSRKVWEPVLEHEGAELTWLPGSPHVFGGKLFVATVPKPAG